jgi:histidinol-phosphate aminotransferase
MVDCATNVRLPGPPPWLRSRLVEALDELGRYPRLDAARTALARRHGRPEDEVLVTAGGTEAFLLIARALGSGLALCVHPSFTEPEALLRGAGHAVDRLVLEPPFELDAALVPAAADMIVLGNPTNPTSVLHPVEVLEALARPGRTLVVDEAFADCVPGEAGSVAGRRDIPGVVVVRSLTKTWGIAGLRVGYVLADPEVVERLAACQPQWPVSSLAAVAAVASSEHRAVAEADGWARELAGDRERLAGDLAALGIEVVPNAAASFLLLRVEDGESLRAKLGALGIAVRRGDTFPGLGPDWLRVAVRDRITNHRVAGAFATALGERGSARPSVDRIYR